MTSGPRRPIGAILAGGHSSRMGTDKALVEVEGRPMLSWVAAALTSAGCDPLVIGRTSASLGIPSEPDDLPGRAGPTAGLATALRLANGGDVFLAATDQPFLLPETVRALFVYDAAVVVPVHDGTLQMTCAVYRAGCLPHLTGLLADDPSIPLRALFDVLPARRVPPDEWRAWGEDGRSWWSLDTPSDVEKAEKWLERSPESRVQSPDTPVDGKSRE